ncbi:MAG: AAA family ATPase [Bryobacteraceae bacterium]
MNKINRIKIGGFRRLEDVDLPVKPFMVLIGANGVGKTSLLDAFSLLSASASGNLNNSVSQFGGITSLLTRDRSRELSLLVDMEVPGHRPLEYELHLEQKGTGYSIAREVLSQASEGYAQPFKHIDSSDGDIRYFQIGQNKLIRPEWEHNPLETSLSQVPKLFRQPEEMRRILATATEYHVLDVGPRAPVKLPQAMKPATLPGAEGEDLVPYLYYLRESDGDRFAAVVDSIRAAFPDFESLSFPPVAAGVLAMTWKDRNFSKPLYMNELSEGTLRFLWLASLLQSPALSTITMIDEPEVSLHPELLNLLAELMREAAKRTQLIVATHSDRFIRFLRPEEVVVMDIDDGGCAKATWADSLDLDSWLAEYALDEVWRMGRMGGRS